MTAILRAGPFAGPGSFFYNEPDPLIRDEDDRIIPINCANVTSSSAWPWRYNEFVKKSLSTHTGCEPTPNGNVPTTSGSTNTTVSTETVTGNFSINSSGTSNHATSLEIGFEFYYQATKSFKIKITYDGEASGGPESFDPGSGILFFDSESFRSISDFPSLSGSVTRTLPASFSPVLYAARLDAGVAIEFPSDFCTPNSGSANASVELEVEFLADN